MRRAVGAIMGAALLAAPLHAKTAEPETLEHSSAWNVDYADDYCRLARVFGTGDAATIVIFDFFEPGQFFKLMVTGKRFRGVSNGYQAVVRFGPNEAMQKMSYLVGDLGKDRPAIIFRGSKRFDSRPETNDDEEHGVPEPLSAERIAAVTEMSIGSPVRPPVKVKLGSMSAALAAVDKCTNNLIRGWGIDPAVNATLSRPVRPNGKPQTWITSEDYPEFLRRQGAQSIIEARFTIDERGTPTACHIQRTTRSAEFDDIVCKTMMKRARFLPALDRGGNPVASYYRFGVTFKIAG